jgi:hypothetical protein
VRARVRGGVPRGWLPALPQGAPQEGFCGEDAPSVGKACLFPYRQEDRAPLRTQGWLLVKQLMAPPPPTSRNKQVGPLPCRCGAEARVLPCHERGFQCARVCGARLACGRHSCERTCHSGPCGACPSEGRRTCPCGKVVYGELKCDEKAPSCGGTCGKPLGCGRHTCVERCHEGPCGKVGAATRGDRGSALAGVCTAHCKIAGGDLPTWPFAAGLPPADLSELFGSRQQPCHAPGHCLAPARRAETWWSSPAAAAAPRRRCSAAPSCCATCDAPTCVAAAATRAAAAAVTA